MKTVQTLKLVLIVLFLFGGLVGCAKPVTEDQAPVTEVDMKTDTGQQQEAKGVDDKSMQGEAVPSHDQMAGMERIYFDFDQFTLSSEARQILGANAKYLNTVGDVNVVIEGHCDERGSDEYNLALGESRALAAKSYLVSLGISAKRLSVISYGEEKALVDAANEEAWAKNRRAEFKSVN